MIECLQGCIQLFLGYGDDFWGLVPSSIIHVAVRLTFNSAEPGKQEWHLFQKESHTIVSVTIASPDYPSELTSHSHTSSTHSIAAQEA